MKSQFQTALATTFFNVDGHAFADSLRDDKFVKEINGLMNDGT